MTGPTDKELRNLVSQIEAENFKDLTKKESEYFLALMSNMGDQGSCALPQATANKTVLTSSRFL